MNQVIFANELADSATIAVGNPFDINFTLISDIGSRAGDSLSDKPNEDFIIEYMTPSKTIKTIEVNRETLTIQKVDSLEIGDGEYYYIITIDAIGDDPSIQVIRQNAVPHQRNSWYLELNGDDVSEAEISLFNQLKVLSKSDLIGITYLTPDYNTIGCRNPLTFKGINCTITVVTNVLKNPIQYIKSLLEKNAQNLGYNHTDDNLELNSGLADYKAWINTVDKENTNVWCLRFATNRKASKTRDERVWQNVYICSDANSGVNELLEAYLAILNGEETEGGE